MLRFPFTFSFVRGVIYTGYRSEHNKQIDANKTVCCRRVLVVTELFNIAVNGIDAKESPRCKWFLVANELVYAGPNVLMFLVR